MTTLGVDPEELLCPIPPRRNPNEQGLEEDGLAWMERFALAPNERARQKIIRIGTGDLTAQTYPDADAELVRVCNDMLIWFFVCDDQFDERALGANPQKVGKVCANFMRLLETGNAKAALSPLSQALLDLRQRLWPRANETWRSRFMADMSLYLEGCRLEADNRARGITPDFDEYQRIRRASVGTYPCFTLIELALPAVLSRELAESPALEAARDLATDIIAWINDIVSYAKESAFDDPHNLVTVLMRECGIDEVAAARATVEYHNSRFDNLEQIIAALMRSERSELLAGYVRGIQSWIRGVRDWSFASERYGRGYIALSRAASHLLLSEE